MSKTKQKKEMNMTEETQCFEPGYDPVIGEEFTVGQWVKQMRADTGLTLQELADRVGTSKCYIWDIENERAKNPGFHLVMAICEELMGPVGIYPRTPRIIQ